MGDITLSNALRSNLLSLQNTADLLTKTQQRLSTGLKVNSALDNPSSFFTAQSLNNRANDLGKLLDSVGSAVDTLKAADKGISAITKLVENLKSTANQALATKVVSTTSTSSVESLTSATTRGALTGVATGDQLTITIDGTTYTTSAVAAADTVSGILTKIRNAYSAITATLTSDGAIEIALTTGEDFTIAGNLGGDLGVTGTFTNGTNRNSFVTDYNTLRTQIDQLAKDSSFKGVNLLQSNQNLTVNFNEDQTSSLTINSKLLDTSSNGLNVSAATNSGFATDATIESAISSLDNAITTLRNQSSTFGNNLAIVENRQTFTKDIIETLQTGAGKLTLADTNVEGANLLALQTRQQLGSVSLSLASQADQNVLRLF